MSSGRIRVVREFNRAYTNVIGLLRSRYLDSAYSLTEARLLFELAQADQTEISALRQEVDIDPGYLSRILARFAADGLITREPSAEDARRRVISLTEAGRAVFRQLDQRSTEQIATLLGQLSDADADRLTGAMATITQLARPIRPPATVLLRAPQPGELGWVIQRNGALYAQEYGWDVSYEALVARIVADFAGRSDPGEAPGSPSWTAPRWAACSACGRARRPRGCGCFWSSPGRVGWAWASGWSPSAWPSPAARGTRRSCFGPTTCWPRRGASTSGPASIWSARSRTTALATTWSARTGGCR